MKTWIAILVVMAMAGCNGQWAANSGGGGGGGGQGRNKPHATEDEVRQQFEKLMGAFARRDITAIDSMMASSATFINAQTGPAVLSWVDARPLLEKAFAGSGYELSNDPGYRIGVSRDLGWIATVYHVRAPGQSGPQSDGGVSVLFQKNADGYKVLMFHASHFASAPAEKKNASAGAEKKM